MLMLNARLAAVMVAAACSNIGCQPSGRSGSAAGATGGADAETAPSCDSQPDTSAHKLGASATSEGAPKTLKEALARGQLIVVGAASNSELRRGAVIAIIGGTQYCQNFTLGDLHVERTLKGHTDGDAVTNFGYLESCGPTLSANPIGVDCDLPAAAARFQVAQRTVFVILGPIRASGSNLMLYEIRWSFPITASNSIDLSSVNGGTMTLDDFAVIAASG